MENQDGFKELLANDTVIYAVLKKLHITKAHNDYDDLVSEGRLLYLKAYATNQYTGKRRFNYFFTKIYWSLLDYLRKQQRNHEVEAPIISTADEDWDIVDDRSMCMPALKMRSYWQPFAQSVPLRNGCTLNNGFKAKKWRKLLRKSGFIRMRFTAAKPGCERKLNLFLKKINFEGGKNRGSIR